MKFFVSYGLLLILFFMIQPGYSVCSSSSALSNGKNDAENKKSYLSYPKEDDNGYCFADVDLKKYFQEINGCAVIYDRRERRYSFYNRVLAEKRASPCSTFKIPATLIGLESKVLRSEETVIKWNGNKYPFAEWQSDQTLEHAFKVSCVWFFRNVIDHSDRLIIEKILTQLSYGNCDIGNREGSYNGADPELSGFWLESSLEISPFEQVRALNRIFEEKTTQSKEHVEILKNIMLTENAGGIEIYGKTGTGHKKNAWFVGFAVKENRKYYFAVRLEDDLVTGKKAKEIAINILHGWLR